MKVLIIDADSETRSRIAETVQRYQFGADILFSSDGNDAINLLRNDNEIDAVITSNRLSGLLGTNLLQAIWCNGWVPTLFHSSQATGSMEVGGGEREEIDLSKHTKLFDFATFKIKEPDFSYIEEFLHGVKIDRLATSL